MNWDHGSAWDINNGRFRGTAYGKTNPGRYLTMGSSIDLSAYAGKTVRISWNQDEGGGLESSGSDLDCLYYAFSGDGGGTWSANIEAFRGDNPSSSFDATIPAQYVTNNFEMRFYLYGFNERSLLSTEYCYIDNIGMSVFVAPAYEPPGRYLTMGSSLDLSAHAGQTVEISWEQDEVGTLEDSDCLYYAFYDGNTWSGDYEAFRGNDPQSNFSATIPNGYLTSNFRMRFYLDGFSESGEYCHIDNIEISVMPPLVENAKVNQVMFGTTGKMTEITTSESQVALTPDAVGGSWSYSCYYDATDIVRAQLDPNANSGTFTLGHAFGGSGYALYPSGTTAYPLATPALCTGWGCTRYQWTYAGWSLLIIYSSPQTKGHQLYLFDTFRYVGEGGNPTQVPFSISGFLAPDDTTGSHLTYFVGEGDAHYTGDSIEINGNPLSDASNPWNNVFNSLSNAISDSSSQSGIDIDTFDVSKYVAPDETSADVLLITSRGQGNVAEIYNLVYIILSFRSTITSGGVMGYLIRG